MVWYPRLADAVCYLCWRSWTEVYPRLLGVPEMSTYLARWWVSGLQWLDSAIRLRAENQPKVNYLPEIQFYI